MTSLKKQSTKAFAWDFAGKIAAQSVGFFISIFLARLLAPEDFGLLAMVNVVIALSASLMDMGLGVALIQRKEVTEAHYGSVFFFNIGVGVLLAVILFFAAPLVGYFYDNTLLVPMARAMSALFILRSIGNVLRMKLRKDLEYGIPTQSNLLGATISGIIGVLMAINGYGVWSLVAQSLLNPIFSNAYLFYRVRWRPKMIFQWQSLKDLWSFGMRMFLSGILDTIFVNADSLIIGKLFNSATLGFYYRSRSLNNYIIQYSSASLMSVLMPAFSKVQDDILRFRSAVFKSFHLINFLAFFLTGLFFVIGDHLILLLFGEKWQPSIPLFRLIILTAYGLPISAILVNILAASGNSKKFLQLEVIKKVIFGFALGFGFLWGIEGYLIANIIAYALAVYANIIYAGKQLKTGQWWFIRIIIPYLLLVGVIAVPTYKIIGLINTSNLISLIMGGFFFTSIFVVFAWFLKLPGFKLLIDELRALNIFDKNKFIKK